jgi:RimJ/RimL family protein N-acetyltransferase
MNVILETKRLVLREMHSGDLDFLAEMLGDPEVMRFFPSVVTREVALQHLEKNFARYREFGYGFWLVVQKETGQPIGRCGLLRQEVDGQPEDEIGYMLHRPYWRQDFGIEAASGVRDYALQELGKRRLISMIRPVNIPSQRTALANGMKPERLTMFYGLEHLVFALERGS